MTVDTPNRRLELKDDLPGLYRRIGELTGSAFTAIDARFDRVEIRLDRVETRLDRVETRLADVETGLAETREQVHRLEVATNRLADRMDARFEQLIGLFERRERGQN